MSRHGEIELLWGDDRCMFRLGYRELMQLQEACGAGPAFIANRLRGDNWLIQDIRETIRLGRIGAGAKQGEALADITRFVDNVPLQENRMVAWAILQASLIGATDEVIEGKTPGAEKPKAPRSPTAKSPSLDLSVSPP